MREIQIGDKEIRVRATPLALLFYKQEFGTDLIGDLVQMQDLMEDMTKFDSITLLQIIWAMNKADDSKGFPSFEKWVAELECFDFTDAEVMLAVMEEATDGFFRSSGNR